MAINFAHAQTQEQIDSLVTVMCNSFGESKGLPDTVRIFKSFQQHVAPFTANFSEEKDQEVRQAVFFRLQRNCDEFMEIVERFFPPKNDWRAVDKRPDTKLSRKECKALTEYKRHWYHEPNGDTVGIELKNGFWIDHFKDGSYSKLKFRWVDDCAFEIEFVESNHWQRKKLSKPGDRYRYQLVEKKDGHYEVAVENEGSQKVYMFKIYFE